MIDHIFHLILQSMLLIRCDIYTLFDGNRFETEFSSCIQLLIQILRHCAFISFVVNFERILDCFGWPIGWRRYEKEDVEEEMKKRLLRKVLFLRREFCEKNFREIAKEKDHFWNRVCEAYSWRLNFYYRETFRHFHSTCDLLNHASCQNF